MLAPLDEFRVTVVPTLLLGYLKAHGYSDAETGHVPGNINVTYYGMSYGGFAVSYRKTIPATMEAVREFLGYQK